MPNNAENEVYFKADFSISSPSHGLVWEEPSETEEPDLYDILYLSSAPAALVQCVPG